MEDPKEGLRTHAEHVGKMPLEGGHTLYQSGEPCDGSFSTHGSARDMAGVDVTMSNGNTEGKCKNCDKGRMAPSQHVQLHATCLELVRRCGMKRREEHVSNMSSGGHFLEGILEHTHAARKAPPRRGEEVDASVHMHVEGQSNDS